MFLWSLFSACTNCSFSFRCVRTCTVVVIFLRSFKSSYNKKGKFSVRQKLREVIYMVPSCTFPSVLVFWGMVDLPYMHDVNFVGCPPKEDISCFSSFPMKKYRYYVDTRFKVLSSFPYMQRNMLLLQRIR